MIQIAGHLKAFSEFLSSEKKGNNNDADNNKAGVFISLDL